MTTDGTRSCATRRRTAASKEVGRRAHCYAIALGGAEGVHLLVPSIGIVGLSAPIPSGHTDRLAPASAHTQHSVPPSM